LPLFEMATIVAFIIFVSPVFSFTSVIISLILTYFYL